MSRTAERALETLGVHNLRCAVDPALVRQAATRCNEGVARVATETGFPESRITRLTSAWSGRAPFVEEVVAMVLPALVPIARRLDLTAAPVDASLFHQAAGAARATHAHQDIPYKWNQPVERRHAATTWLALDACGAGSGGLAFSLAFGSREVEVRQDFLARDFVDRAQTRDWKREEVVVEVEPGDVVVFDSLAWHASSPVGTAAGRRALAVRWASNSGWESRISLPHPSIDPTAFGMDTSGDILVHAIRRACPDLGEESGGTVRSAVTGFLRRTGERDWAPFAAARRHLEDLGLALSLERHGGRTAAQVWLTVRDAVLPALAEMGLRPEGEVT